MFRQKCSFQPVVKNPVFVSDLSLCPLVSPCYPCVYEAVCSPSEMVCPHENKFGLKLGMSFCFKWKQSNYSGARILIYYSNVFISKCYGLGFSIGVWELSLHCLQIFPHWHPLLVPQMWLCDIIWYASRAHLEQLTSPFALTWRCRWQEVPAGMRKCFSADNLENFS